jgi:hypothetical protein
MMHGTMNVKIFEDVAHNRATQLEGQGEENADMFSDKRR